MLSFTPRRSSQPYTGAERPETPQLAAMLAGRPLFAANPMDQRRQMQRLAALILGRPTG